MGYRHRQGRSWRRGAMMGPAMLVMLIMAFVLGYLMHPA
jgi:hypothetical protein